MTEAEDKAKAEKLAAAKKRVEALKKQKAKKSGGATKKKDDKPEKAEESSAAAEEKADGAEEDAIGGDAEGDGEAAKTGAETAASPIEDTVPDRPPHNRQPSLTLQSKMRSDSFRKASGAQSPGTPLKSPIFPQIDPGADVQEVYKKQAARIDELEKENKRLQGAAQDAEARRNKAEEELDELREASGEVAELKSKADQAGSRAAEADKLKGEVASLQRQNSQLQSQASKRRQSTASPSDDDVASQLASKSNTIESLEFDISNLHNQLSQATATHNEHLARITHLESELERAQRESEASAQELSDLKGNVEQASARAAQEGSSLSSAETRIAQLQTELSAAQRTADSASKRAETLEKKVETLTTLHRDSDARHQAKAREFEKTERDARELRSRIAHLHTENSRLAAAGDRLRKAHAQGDDDGVDELEDEERVRLATRVRELEEEVFELRRGVWRDRRREMQPTLDANSAGAPSAEPFDDIDLSGTPLSPRTAAARAGPYGHSSFSDVINSGISAFTGSPATNRARAGSSNAAMLQTPRKQSMGLLEEDDDEFAFDEDAFRKAQEDEMKKRIERVKEIKRGLAQWKGWRVDLVDMRAGMGGVFDV